MWGLLAIIALIVTLVFFANLNTNIEASSTTPLTLLPGAGEQVEWSIEVGEYAPTPGVVTLKGDTPLGFPTETWQGDFMVARSVGNTFEWNMEISPELPVAVYEIDQAKGSCDDLTEHLNNWVTESPKLPVMPASPGCGVCAACAGHDGRRGLRAHPR